MNALSLDFLKAYWSAPEVAVNLVIFLNLAGALALGMLVGYERAYHGRAAGMRTYGLVCMASAALTVITGYPEFWFGTHVAHPGVADPTRVIQGIVTGVGFLGAGVIMKDGLNISGLTTAASIWSACAIGVMVGVGFYAAAILLTLLSAASMMWMSKLEIWLPSRQAVALVLRFRPRYVPREDVLRRVARERGYEIAGGTLSVKFNEDAQEWHFIAVAIDKKVGTTVTALADELTRFEGVESFQLAYARN
jgi:putative Mg2+ transporter-C (MgtC) family protein